MESEPRVVLSMRLDPETEQVIDALAARFGLTRSAVVRQAVRRWAHAEGIPVPTPAPRGKGGAALAARAQRAAEQSELVP